MNFTNFKIQQMQKQLIDHINCCKRVEVMRWLFFNKNKSACKRKYKVSGFEQVAEQYLLDERQRIQNNEDLASSAITAQLLQAGEIHVQKISF